MSEMNIITAASLLTAAIIISGAAIRNRLEIEKIDSSPNTVNARSSCTSATSAILGSNFTIFRLKRLLLVPKAPIVGAVSMAVRDTALSTSSTD